MIDTYFNFPRRRLLGLVKRGDSGCFPAGKPADNAVFESFESFRAERLNVL